MNVIKWQKLILLNNNYFKNHFITSGLVRSNKSSGGFLLSPYCCWIEKKNKISMKDKKENEK